MLETYEHDPPVGREVLAAGWQAQLLGSGNFAADLQSVDEVQQQIADMQVHKFRYRGRIYLPPTEDGKTPDVIMVFVSRKERAITPEEIKARYFEYNFWWLNWDYTDTYRHNPFTRGLQEVFALGTEAPGTLVYNAGPPLDDVSTASIRDTYEWFNRETAGAIFEKSRRVVIGNHISFKYDDITRRHAEAKGVYANWQRLVSLDSFGLTHPYIGPTFQRYADLLERGADLADILVTHELGHALAPGETDPVQVLFNYMVGWREHNYKIGRGRSAERHAIEGLGRRFRGLPVTDYGWLNSREDLAEATVYYRFAPELLGAERLEIMEALFEMIRAGRLSPKAAQMAKLPGVIYPYKAVPEELHVPIGTHADVEYILGTGQLFKAANRLIKLSESSGFLYKQNR